MQKLTLAIGAIVWLIGMAQNGWSSRQQRVDLRDGQTGQSERRGFICECWISGRLTTNTTTAFEPADNFRTSPMSSHQQDMNTSSGIRISTATYFHPARPLASSASNNAQSDIMICRAQRVALQAAVGRLVRPDQVSLGLAEILELHS
ncbi:hypothetical protein F5878DRAFT_399287 [Lentinula raphanica]|uniref:Uncharacterized protein n=1 Tax=Lentinula raphanica TaxID=153919 RepID=A0AA38NZY9_9AGAR|nr:hypothetical protein F5878DRAFT_399287 [Lentinula raphanica]